MSIACNNKAPRLTLHNPNGQQVAIVSEYTELSISMQLTGLSTLSFKVPYNERHENVYDRLVTKRLIKAEGYGQFIISTITDEDDGVIAYRNIECNSLENELSLITIQISEGVYSFYDITGNEETLLSKIMSYIPNWTLSDVDSDLWSIKRYVQDTTSTLYGFMMSDLSKTMDCLFIFDTENRTISIKKYANAVTNTDIIAKYSNLVKSTSIEENANNIITCLNVTGGEDVSIMQVNPLGGDKIYNFDYYVNYQDEAGISLMSNDLIIAIQSWKAKIENKKTNYSSLIQAIKDKNTSIVVLEGELSALQIEYTTLETLYSVRIKDGQNATDIWYDMRDKENEINAKIYEIDVAEEDLQDLLDDKLAINNDLALSNIDNFSLAERNELALYIVEMDYNDTYYMISDTMTEDEKVEVYEDLYQKGLLVLEDVSTPSLTFSTELINFLMLEEYALFKSQFKLGCIIRLELRNKTWAYPVLLGYTISFDEDKQSSVSMDFSNNLRLKNDEESLFDMLEDAIKTANTVSVDSYKWNGYEKDKSYISEYMENDLDLTLQRVISSQNQEMVIGQNGIIGREMLENGTYSPEQLWINNNTILMSDDSFQSAKMALGKMTAPDGTGVYGLNTELLVGKMVISNALHIENEDLSFVVNENGASLLNADFAIENDKNKILLSPDDGILIQAKVGSSLEDRFYADDDGNLVLEGTIYAENGEFNGTVRAAEIIGSTITNGNNFSVDEYGSVVANDIEITGGSLNINDKFVVDEDGNVQMTGSISWGDNEPVKVQYSSNNSSWHNSFVNGDMYIRYSYDGGETWTTGIKFVGEDGLNGANGSDGRDAILPEYITETYIDETEIRSPFIQGGLIEGAILRAVGIGETAVELMDGTRALKGYISYDSSGDGTEEESRERMFIGTTDNTALKIYSGADMSISAEGTVWMGNIKLVQGAKIYNSDGSEYGGSGVAVFG